MFPTEEVEQALADIGGIVRKTMRVVQVCMALVFIVGIAWLIATAHSIASAVSAPFAKLVVGSISFVVIFIVGALIYVIRRGP